MRVHGIAALFSASLVGDWQTDWSKVLRSHRDGCAYCGGLDLEAGRHRCLSCGAPRRNTALLPVVVADTSHVIERAPIDATNFSDTKPVYVLGVARSSAYSPNPNVQAPPCIARTRW